MHLVYENLIPNLVLMWTGHFKGLDEGNRSYELPSTVWEAIGKATQESGSTIPYAYGARPRNVVENKSSITADMWSFWTLYLAPPLLENRFTEKAFYTHFIELVKLINLCLQFDLTRADILAIREGFQTWVLQYEKLYYQYEPSRLPTCPAVVHDLLHIADGIESLGPVWAYWAFPMERYCGRLLPAIKSRRFPFANIDNFVMATAQIAQIKIVYGLKDDLLLGSKNSAALGLAIPEYEEFRLHSPRIQSPTLDAGIREQLIAAVSTRYDKSMTIARRVFDQSDLEVWGRIGIVNGGDIMRACEVGKRSAEDSRDATFVRYELLVDRNARFKNKKPKLEPQTHYGQLQRIFLIRLRPSKALGIPEGETIILVAIKSCKIIRSTALDMHCYKVHGSTDIVDATTLQCLVGRIFDRKQWVIFDRSGNLARPSFDI
ncbi:hypothetical protein CPC08DRAFT_738871 [Agrocybe pediades]|nr:hypothetical protein CPC08DRAFT_738871 [Agrocybe pediades]